MHIRRWLLVSFLQSAKRLKVIPVMGDKIHSPRSVERVIDSNMRFQQNQSIPKSQTFCYKCPSFFHGLCCHAELH